MSDTIKRKNYFPRLLIISHNLYDETNNIGKTLVSLLGTWPKEKLAQIYFRNDCPSFSKCKNYYCITDRDVVLSLLTFGERKAGKQLFDYGKKGDVSGTEKNLYRIGNKRYPIVSLVRDIIWSIGTWKNNTLKKWILEFDPEIVLFVPNDYVLAYKVVTYVLNIKKVPLIPFYMDDAFYFDCKTDRIDSLRRIQLRSAANLIHSNASCLFTICDKMSKKYMEYFKLPCFDFVNSVIPSDFKPKVPKKDSIKFSYIGNLHSNRWKCLLDIAEVLQFFNQTQTKIKTSLHIFSASDISEEVRASFASLTTVFFEGSIPPSEVLKQQREADILVHVESFDEKSKNSTRYSLSTKIPEYLNSGVCVFAYGPNDVASIEYLKNKNIAFVCSNKADLKMAIEKIAYSPDLRIQFEERGLKVAKAEHNILRVSNLFINKIKACYYGEM